MKRARDEGSGTVMAEKELILNEIVSDPTPGMGNRKKETPRKSKSLAFNTDGSERSEKTDPVESVNRTWSDLGANPENKSPK